MNSPPRRFHEDTLIARNSIVRQLAQGERLNAVLAEICDSVEEMLPDIKATIQIVTPLYADEKKLRQILFNLLSNALKFTDQGGTVTLTVWYSDSSGYVMQVEDTGIGIALEDIPKALGLFGQVDSAFNRRYEGTGLGLPLSKSLA